MVLASREVAAMLVGMLVRRILLALGEVASPRLMDALVAGLLALGEVAKVLLLEGVALVLLAGREGSVLGVVSMIVVLADVVVVVVVVGTVIVVGSFAHARLSQAMRMAILWTAGQDAVGRMPSADSASCGAASQ